jgi:hypothetical protein
MSSSSKPIAKPSTKDKEEIEQVNDNDKPNNDKEEIEQVNDNNKPNNDINENGKQPSESETRRRIVNRRQTKNVKFPSKPSNGVKADVTETSEPESKKRKKRKFNREEISKARLNVLFIFNIQNKVFICNKFSAVYGYNNPSFKNLRIL